MNSEFLYLKSRLSAFGIGRELFDQDVVRNRTNYQFGREHTSPLTRDRREGLHRLRRTLFVKVSHNFRR